MVRDEIEDPDEKPQERRNGKEPAASDNGLLGRPAYQRKKTAIPNASRKSGIIFIHCSIAALAASGAMVCQKFSPALDAKASEAISSGRATTAFFMDYPTAISSGGGCVRA